MANNKITIFEESISIIDNSKTNTIEIFNESNNGFIKIFDPGPTGPRGPTGFSGAGEPFYPIVPGELYATTASIAIKAFVSSSILPWSSSFDLGSITNPWKNIYVSNSLFVGESKITTSSFGFDDYFIKRVSSNQQILIVKSGSVSASFNNDGVFAVPDFSSFSTLPTTVPGGIIKSGSEYFFGI